MSRKEWLVESASNLKLHDAGKLFGYNFHEVKLIAEKCGWIDSSFKSKFASLRDGWLLNILLICLILFFSLSLFDKTVPEWWLLIFN